MTEVQGVATWSGSRDGASGNPPIEYTLITCKECGDASLEMREDYGNGFEADQPVFAYPAKRRLSSDVPPPLRREFGEAQLDHNRSKQ